MLFFEEITPYINILYELGCESIYDDDEVSLVFGIYNILKIQYNRYSGMIDNILIYINGYYISMPPTFFIKEFNDIKNYIISKTNTENIDINKLSIT